MAGGFKVVDEVANDRMAGAPSVASYLPRILLYPLTGYCLPVLIFGTPLTWMLVQTLLAFASEEPGSMVGWLMRISGTVTGASWLLSYCMRVIERTASGHATPPPMSGDTTWSGSAWFFRAMVYPAAFATLYFAVSDRSPHVAWGLVVLGVLLWPAHALSLATEGRLFFSLDPARLLSVITATGPLYLLVCGVAGLAVWLLRAGGFDTLMPMFSLLSLYLVVMNCHLLGFIAYRRHHQLGLYVEVGDPLEKEHQREQAQRLQMVCARIEACVVEGDMDGALRELRAEPGGPADVPRFHEDLFARLLSRATPAPILAQGQRLITVLLNERRYRRALEVYENCLGRDRFFEPQTPLQLEIMAREALNSRLDDLFLRMLGGLDQRYPGDAILVSAGLMQARYWAERRNDDARALEILRPLLALERHPQHTQVKALVRALGG